MPAKATRRSGYSNNYISIQKALNSYSFKERKMVPGAGLEPAHSNERGILNPLCLPISPPGHWVSLRLVQV